MLSEGRILMKESVDGTVIMMIMMIMMMMMVMMTMTIASLPVLITRCVLESLFDDDEVLIPQRVHEKDVLENFLLFFWGRC